MIQTQTICLSAFGPLDEDDNDEGHGMRIHHPDSPSSSSLPDMPSSSSSSSLSPASLSIGTSSDHEGPSVPASQEPRVEPLNSSTTTTPEGDSHLLSSGPHLREERKKGWRGFMGDVFIWKRKAGHARWEICCGVLLLLLASDPLVTSLIFFVGGRPDCTKSYCMTFDT